ncbi:hypothetical protein TNCV_1841391 [Trichonephila clavipes]|nr:hypothetical protein TNCV_1841391 [Trichonephila clavipes]
MRSHATNNFSKFHSFRRRKGNHCPSFLLVQIDNGAALLNGLLHSNNYEVRRVTRCIEGLPTKPHAMMDTSVVPQLFERRVAKIPLLFDFPS